LEEIGLRGAPLLHGAFSAFEGGGSTTGVLVTDKMLEPCGDGAILTPENSERDPFFVAPPWNSFALHRGKS
jgi:hypothetical protein